MKVRIIVSKEVEIEIKNDKALLELDNFYRTHEVDEWSKVEVDLINKAVETVEVETGLCAFEEECPKDTENIVGVYAMDGQAILEW